MAVVDESGALRGLDNATINDAYELGYDVTLGYWARKK
jgi:hypothetical protein